MGCCGVGSSWGSIVNLLLLLFAFFVAFLLLFFGLGLVYYEGGEELILDEEYSIIMDEESLEKYYIGGYGIVLTKDEWNYGYYTVCLSHCFLPPEEKYYYLDNDDEEDKVAMEIMKRIDEMDIYD